jgi:YVTN family beta-propeller protein
LASSGRETAIRTSIAPLAASAATGPEVATARRSVDPITGFFQSLAAFFNNQTPTLNPRQTGEDASGVVTGLLGAVDPDSPTLTYKLTQDGARGTVQINADGSYTYTPQAAYAQSGTTDSFTVRVSDAASGFAIHGLPGLINLLTFGLVGSSGNTSTRTVNVTVAPFNPPTKNDAAGAWTITAVTMDPLDGSGPAPVDQTGTITITKTGDSYIASITQTVNGNTYISPVATLTQTGPNTYNGAPSADQIEALRQNLQTSLSDTYASQGVTGITITNFVVTSTSRLTLSDDGQTMTYVNPFRATYTQTYTYNGSTHSANGGEEEVYTYTATKATEAAGIPVAGTPIVNAADPRTGSVTGIAVFTDPKGAPLTYTVTTNPTQGTITQFDSHTGEFTYTPTTDASVTDTFAVTASNGTHTATQTISVTVPAAVPGASVISTDAATGASEGTVSGIRQSVTYTVSQTSPYGTATVDPKNGRWSFTPTVAGLVAAWSGNATPTATFTITATNTADPVATTPITVTVPLAVSQYALVALVQRSGSRPAGVAVGTDGTVYVINSGANTLSVLRPDGTSILSTVKVGVSPSAVTVGTDGRVWVANGADGTVTVLDHGGTVIGTPINVGSSPIGLAVAPDGTVYVANAGDGTISVIAADTNTVDRTITVGGTPTGIATGPDGHIYIADFSGTAIKVVDPVHDDALTTIDNAGANPFGIAVGSDGTIFVTDPLDGTVTVLTPTAGSYTNRTVTVGDTPVAITVGANGFIYVADTDANAVTAIDTRTFSATTIATGINPNSITTGPDGNLYVTNGGSDTLDIINIQNSSTTTIPVGVDPNTVTVDTQGNLSVTTDYGNTVSVISHPTTGIVTTGTTVTGTAIAGTETTGTVTTVTATASGYTISFDDNPTGAVVSPDGRYAYVYDYYRGLVTVINHATGTATTHDVGLYPHPVVVSPDSRYAYVVSYDPYGNHGGTVTVINPATGTATTHDVGIYPRQVVVSPDSRYAYVTDPDGSVLVINPATGTATTMDVNAWDATRLAISPDSRYVYVTGYADGTVTVINPAAGTATTIDTGTQPGQVVVSPDSRYAYAHTFDGTVLVINPATGTATNIPSGANFSRMEGIVVSPDSRYAYAHTDDGTVVVVNSAAGTATTIHTGTQSGRVVVSPDSRHAYAVSSDDGTVTVINPATGTATTTIHTSTPETLVVSPDSRHAYVTDGRSVLVINPATGTVNTIHTAGFPGQVVVSPDSRYAYVTVYSNGTVDDAVLIINPATATATIIDTGADPGQVVVSPDSRYAYVLNGRYTSSPGTVSVINPATSTATTIPVGSMRIDGGEIVVSPDSRYAYVTTNSTVVVVNPGAGTATTLNTGTYPHVTAGPDGSYAYILPSFGSSAPAVSIIDPATGITTIKVPMTPDHVGWTALSSDRRYAYVHVPDSTTGGTVKVLDATKVTFRIAPDSSPDTYINTPVTFDPTDNPFLPDTGVTITGISAPANGTAVLNGSRITYTPNADYTGTDTFTYTATNGISTDTGSIVVHVNELVSAPSVPPAPSGYTYIDTPTTVRGLFERLWATTNHVGDGMHIDTVYGDHGEVHYVVYFAGTGFTSKQSLLRNAGFFETSTPYVEQAWLQKIKDAVESRNSPIMLVGFSQGGMDAQNIGAALSADGYSVKDVITLASPVTLPPSTAYTTLNFTPLGDAVADVVKVYPGNVLAPNYPFESSYKSRSSDAGQVYEKWVGFQGLGGGFPQHGNLATYLTLADKFDGSTFDERNLDSTVASQIQNDIRTFSGQTLVADTAYVRIDDGTPGGLLVPTF